MIVIALVSSILLSAGSLAFVFFETGFNSFGVWILIFGVAWLFALWRGWGWFSTIGLFLAVMVSAMGLWLRLAPGWIFAGAIFALAAWDLTDFRERMRFVAADDNARGMERRHLARLTLLSLAGLALASVTMILRVRFTIEWGALLVIVILLGLSQLVGWFRRQ